MKSQEHNPRGSSQRFTLVLIVLAVTLAGTYQLVATHAATITNNYAPTGSIGVDNCSATVGGSESDGDRPSDGARVIVTVYGAGGVNINSGDSNWSYTVPAAYRDGSDHTIYATGRNVNSAAQNAGTNSNLSNSPVTYNSAKCAPTPSPTPTPTPSPTPTPTPTPSPTPTPTPTPSPTPTPTPTPSPSPRPSGTVTSSSPSTTGLTAAPSGNSGSLSVDEPTITDLSSNPTDGTPPTDSTVVNDTTSSDGSSFGSSSNGSHSSKKTKSATTKKTSALKSIIAVVLLLALIAGGVIFFLIRRRQQGAGPDTDNYYSFPEVPVAKPLPTPTSTSSIALPLPHQAPVATNELERRINNAFYPGQSKAVAGPAAKNPDEPQDMFELANQHPETFGNLHYNQVAATPIIPTAEPLALPVPASPVAAPVLEKIESPESPALPHNPTELKINHSNKPKSD